MENFKKLTGADMVRVPFRGGGETANGVLSGTTPVAFSGLVELGVLSADRHRSSGWRWICRDALPMFPDVPTLAELGYKIDLTRVYFGIVAPAARRAHPRPAA